MILSAFAAARMPGTSEVQAAGRDYQPGTCNIGPAEIARRRRAGHVGLVATVVVLAALLAIDAPQIARIVVAVPAAVAASGYLQAWLKFCAGFGSRGIFNFGPVGDSEQVVDSDARSQDRVKARQIGLASLAVGLAVGIAAALLPL